MERIDDKTGAYQGGLDGIVADRPRLPRRRLDTHKGDYGRLFILAGSVGYTGAAALAARAAVRGGAGLVTLGVPQEIYPILAVKCDEAMVWPLPKGDGAVLERAQGSDAVLIGPGLGRGRQTEEMVLRLLTGLSCPVVLDADGINAVSLHIDVLDKREGLTILTPHDGEFARLTEGQPSIQNRVEAARGFARDHRCVLVLKGHRTVTAHWSGKCIVNSTGNPGMARGGSGDALAGLMAALLAQGRGADSAAEAVWLHGRAGDLAAADKGEYGMTVGDLIQQIPYALKEVTDGKEP